MSQYVAFATYKSSGLNRITVNTMLQAALLSAGFTNKADKDSKVPLNISRDHILIDKKAKTFISANYPSDEVGSAVEIAYFEYPQHHAEFENAIAGTVGYWKSLQGYEVTVNDNGSVQVGCTLLRPTTFKDIVTRAFGAAMKIPAPQQAYIKGHPFLTTAFVKMIQAQGYQEHINGSNRAFKPDTDSGVYLGLVNGKMGYSLYPIHSNVTVQQKHIKTLANQWEDSLLLAINLKNTGNFDGKAKSIASKVTTNGYTLNFPSPGHVELSGRLFRPSDIIPVVEKWKEVMAKKEAKTARAIKRTAKKAVATKVIVRG